MAGEHIDAAALTQPLTLRTQVCVVGSGAGGAITAMRLAEAGIDVVMVEAGPAVGRGEFRMDEAEAFASLYQDRGTRLTADGSIAVLQGRNVGGGTTINWTTCYRTPERILDHWAKRHGVHGLSARALEPHFEAVEKRLSVSPWPEAMANANNRKLLDGARKLGWQAEATRRNVRGCVNSGYCGMGCPVDGKQAMHITAIPDAIAAGMILVSNCPVQRVEREGARLSAVLGRGQGRKAAVAQGQSVRVEADVVVLSAGAINGPGLLLRSGLNHQGRVGKRTFLHPVIGVAGVFEQPVQGFYGAPQSIASHQFVEAEAGELGFFFEAAPVHPMLIGSALPSFGAKIESIMERLDRISVLIALHVDGLVEGDDGGEVRLRAGGAPALHYPTRAPLRRAMKRAHQRLFELLLAAGATEAVSMHLEAVVARRRDDIGQLEKARYGAFEHAIFSAHQMGGCAMGAGGVLSDEFRFRGLDNLFVIDGSVLPTALGVNPSLTIYGLAHWAASRVGEQLGKTL